ncbi:hypothetical protein OVY01_11850 [Robbsia sp. Bb-Pol-6]|uniref:Uncharacterized protein n=1 Tax=Robbsia betulipollinis TaxID=2981849 RepID=A0ABT3ZN27_9BURK|nr:hypothetical protein [Robbsia betulipollinis]MCY0387916.1 hypothetical protein [Robbsia betulipollinis]
MQLVLRAMFGRNGDGTALSFKPGVLTALKAERDASLDDSLLPDIQKADALFDTVEVPRVTDEWFEQAVCRGTARKAAA